MGYMGLKSWHSSDGAADFMYVLMKKMAKECERELKDKANCYNTPGCINIALMAEAMFKPGECQIYDGDDMFIILTKTKKKIKKRLKNAEKQSIDEWASRDMHITAYKRMIKHLDTILIED